MNKSTLPIWLTILTSALLLSACGGGGGDNGQAPLPRGNGNTPQTPVWVAGRFENENNFKDICATPRTGIDSFSGAAFPDRAGTAMHEILWLRSWSDNTYLWYDELDDNDPQPFSVLSYFNQLKTNLLTDSGSAKDNFHFSQSTEEYNTRTQSGVTSGYGISFEFVSTRAPRRLIVRYTEPNSPAAIAGVSRGLELQAIDDIDFINATSQPDIDAINDALFPSDSGQTRTFVFTNPYFCIYKPGQ